MRHDDSCLITRTTITKDPITHIGKPITSDLKPFPCRLGRASGSLSQTQPQEIFTQTLKLYITDINVDIKFADIATISGIKYTVGNVYKPNKHHIEAEITYKGEA
ncbi:DUF3599 family protein [Clostridium estertheticum]|uniref:DUF3599 family protein n=1 Tax=Clostridium estertheticum TaxID=238834 RepID=UPI00124DFCE3|nr:DUF3599 family protein [Clostridium estertheticum]MBZ9615299.1 DUF3599 family protein [Clostridium estertheticum subsp. laramiense]WAG75188.1 DUF3599 family protein [Clostridium estertheticum]